MNVLFIYTNINGVHEDCYSFGLASIVSMTRINGYTAKVLIVREKQEYQNILPEIAAFNPAVIGFTAVSSQFNYVKEVAALVKERFPHVISVCGGIHPTMKPECLLETRALDGIFVGESEHAFIEFLQRIKEGASYRDVDNFGYRKNGDVKINKLKPLVTDLDSLPYPDKEVYPYGNIIKSTGVASFLLSRGCPYLCSYCSNHAIAKLYNLPCNKPRFRSPESTVQEIKLTVNRFHPEQIFFVDDIFGLHKQWRKDFCLLYKEKIRLPFVCLLRANLVDEEFVRLLKEAGCIRISMGIESGNEYVRNTIMNRHLSNEQIIQAFDLVRKYKLESNAINLIGTPGETDEMIWDTIRLNRRVRPTWSDVNIFYPYKGTKLGDESFAKGLVNEELYLTFSNERRDSIMKYPEEYRKKLVQYKKNWAAYVYPYDVKRHLLRFLRRRSFWKHVRTAKHTLMQRMGTIKKKMSKRT